MVFIGCVYHDLFVISFPFEHLDCVHFFLFYTELLWPFNACTFVPEHCHSGLGVSWLCVVSLPAVWVYTLSVTIWCKHFTERYFSCFWPCLRSILWEGLDAQSWCNIGGWHGSEMLSMPAGTPWSSPSGHTGLSLVQNHWACGQLSLSASRYCVSRDSLLLKQGAQHRKRQNWRIYSLDLHSSPPLSS